jgi:hypothetical protein
MYIRRENQIASEEKEMQKIKDQASKCLMTDNSKKMVNKLKMKKLT